MRLYLLAGKSREVKQSFILGNRLIEHCIYIHIDQRVKEYAAENNTTKSNVMVTALARYLGYSSKVALAQRMVELEERIAQLETQMEQLQVECN